jgi:hypothetical protein
MRIIGAVALASMVFLRPSGAAGPCIPPPFKPVLIKVGW